MKYTEKLEQVTYDLYYSMNTEYNRAVALESVAQLLYSLYNNELLPFGTINRLWNELNNSDAPLLTTWSAK